MLIAALPTPRVVADEVYPPPLSITEPVGMGVPVTVTITVSGWVVVTLDGEGVTDTVGVVLPTVTEPELPVAVR
jgi:hypothetical protein